MVSVSSKTEVINKKLEGKAPADLTFQRLEHSEQMIDKILNTVNELWHAITNTSTEACIPSSTSLRAAIAENRAIECDASATGKHSSENAHTRLSRSSVTPVIKPKGSQRISYHLHGRPRTATAPLKEVQYATQGIRRGTTAMLNRPYTSPSFRQTYRKSVVPSTRHLPASESKEFVDSDDGKLFVSNSETKLFVRDSTDLSSRR
jgi:hypothetical protein